MSVERPVSPHNLQQSSRSPQDCRVPWKEVSLCARSKAAKFAIVNRVYRFQFWNKLGWCWSRVSCTITRCTVQTRPLGTDPFRITPETPCLVTPLKLRLDRNSRAKVKGRALWVQAKIHWKSQVRNELKHQDWTDLADALADFCRRAAWWKEERKPTCASYKGSLSYMVYRVSVSSHHVHFADVITDL